MCSGAAPELEERSSFVGRWMDILRPGYDVVKDIEDKEERLRALEHQAVITSLENLMTFPFVKAAVESEKVMLHGLWTNIADGSLQIYDPAAGGFRAV